MIEKDSCGILYVAFGFEFIIQASNSARTARELFPELQICVLTNTKINPHATFEGKKLFDKVIYIDAPNLDNRLYKTDLYRYTPYEKTLFLDCDTEVRGDIKLGFRFLDYYDLAVRLHPYPIDYNDRFDIRTPFKTYEFSHWNTGVMFFKKSKATQDFFESWSKNFLEFGYPMDQPSFAHCMFYKTQLKYLTLDLSWNVGQSLVYMHRNLGKYLRVLHYRVDKEFATKLYKLQKDNISSWFSELDRQRDQFKLEKKNFERKYRPFFWKTKRFLRSVKSRIG